MKRNYRVVYVRCEGSDLETFLNHNAETGTRVEVRYISICQATIMELVQWVIVYELKGE